MIHTCYHIIAYHYSAVVIISFICIIKCITYYSNWESLEAYCEQPELVHDILDDSDQEYFDDEDDENG